MKTKIDRKNAPLKKSKTEKIISTKRFSTMTENKGKTNINN